jgi:iron(III) transport system substrate-binding protein
MVARTRWIVSAILLTALLSTSCASSTPSSSSESLTLYTCATEKIEQALIAEFEKSHPGSKIDVFRAPTGQLNSRVAADVRGGGIKADVIWACDPLTMHGYDQQGLLTNWTAATSTNIDAAYRTQNFTGVDLLYLVAVTHKGVPAPKSWSDLTAATYRGTVAIPSPTFAASALGMLGYFAAEPRYGVNYFAALKANGAKQVNSPDEVLTGVAQGTYKAGFALANSAYAAQKKGSPIDITWPKPGAIAIYAPIGVTTKKQLAPLARDFADYVASNAGQLVIGKSGAYSVRPDVSGPPMPAGSPIVSPPWAVLFSQVKDLLARYQTVYGS